MSINEKEKNLKVEINDTELKGVSGGDNLPNGFTQDTASFDSIGGNEGVDHIAKSGKGRRKFDS